MPQCQDRLRRLFEGAAFIPGRRLMIFLLFLVAFIVGRRLFEGGVFSNNYGNVKLFSLQV